MAKRIPDDAIVVRGGRNEPADLARAMGTHPGGVRGVSVESAEEKSVKELSANLPHNRVGVTTVAAVRAVGGDVIRTSGRSAYHATLTGLSSEQASRLLTPTIANPAKEPNGPSE